MNKKCTGCGAILQIIKPELEGYVEPDMFDKSSICRRCFRLKFYGDYIFINKSNEEYESILNSISKTGDLVVYMVDVFDISDELIRVDKILNNPIILALTKRDLLPHSAKEDKIINHLKTYKLDVINTISISSEKDYNIDKLYKMIIKYKRSNNVYIVGNTNSGKSTFINRLIKKYSNNKVYITTSMLPTTTLALMDIKVNDKLTIIDTPGLIEDGNIVNGCDYMTLKRILPKKEIRPRTYQIEPINSLMVETFVQVDYKEGTKNSFTCYFANELEIEHVRFDSKIRVSKNKKYSLSIKAGQDIVISGLGWIKVVNPAIVDVFVNERVNVYQRDSII
ncbi:MAG: GTPase [Bacilli bacterium]|jgi:hypothetical protein